MSRYNIAMNYDTYTKNEYTYSAPNLNVGENGIIAFFSDGEYFTFSYDDFSTSMLALDLCAYVSNYSNRNYSDHGNLIAFQVFCYPSSNDYHSLYFLSDNLDYCVIGGGFVYQAGKMDYSTDTLAGGSNDTTYLTNSNFGFSSYTYGAFSGYLNNTKSVFDLSNYKYENGQTYYTDTYPIRGENISFYNHVIVGHSYLTSVPVQYFAYGSPFRDIANGEYERGYGNGYATGWTEGQNFGYELGYNSGVDQNSYNAFNYVAVAFNSVSGILALEVLPHITLGLCFSIPMVFVLIMTMFKLVKK